MIEAPKVVDNGDGRFAVEWGGQKIAAWPEREIADEGVERLQTIVERTLNPVVVIVLWLETMRDFAAEFRARKT